MIKITDYLVWVKDKRAFQEITEGINIKHNLKHQNAFGDLYGSVLESYDAKRMDTKSIISVISIYEIQKEGMEELLNMAPEHKETYEFIDKEVAETLIQKFPKILEAKDKWGWGYEVTRWDEYPREREVNCDICDITCDNCYEDFEICARIDEIEGEKIQCPHCKTELEIIVEYEPVLRSSTMR